MTPGDDIDLFASSLAEGGTEPCDDCQDPGSCMAENCCLADLGCPPDGDACWDAI
jgi:hypothetical protein